jgi:hypothetical protein
MYARVASFENQGFSDPSLAEELTSRAREMAPRWREALPDAHGHLQLIDRESNRGLGITFFESEEDIRAAEPVFYRMGDEMPEKLRGRRVSVETYEVALHEVRSEGKAARVSKLEGPADRVDESIRRSQDEILPRARQMPGWTGVITLVDRSSGKTKLITLWESEDAMRSSEEQAERLRQESAEVGGGRVAGVERYEVAFAERLAEIGERVR